MIAVPRFAGFSVPRFRQRSAVRRSGSYIPVEDVRQDLLEPSDTHTVCPYKGTASYWTVDADRRKLTDAVWSYPRAEGDAAAVSGYRCFRHDDLTIEVGEPG